MGARFTAGDSVATTKSIKAQNNTFSRSQDGNTMKGLRGFIKTAQDKSSSGLASSKGVGPKREGAIGQKGGSGDKGFNTASFGGSSDKSYYGSSTAKPGKVVSNKNTPSSRPAVDQRDSGRRPGNNKAPLASARGTMESLRGRAKTSWEK